jgi:hypothetical protein
MRIGIRVRVWRGVYTGFGRLTVKAFDKDSLLRALDSDRWKLSDAGGVAREFSPDRSSCRIVAARLDGGTWEDLVVSEKLQAQERGYSLEWKTYEHDGLAELPRILTLHGFVQEDDESVLVWSGDPTAAGAFPQNNLGAREGVIITRARDERDLESVAEIARANGRRNVEEERLGLLAMLHASPDEVGIYVLWEDGMPVSCGRLHFPPGSVFAELAGGRKRPTHRRRGHFSALVRHRLEEAYVLGRRSVLVDALPTSEGTLLGLGFRRLTRTRPYIFEPEK